MIALKEIAKCKSITLAAQRVFLSQSALTQALVKMEEKLDTTLFERQMGGVHITKEGEVFLFRVERSLDLIYSAFLPIIGFKKHHLLAITTIQLKSFLAVCEATNYSEAARRNNTHQSAIFRGCKALSEIIGAPLFEKTSIGLIPTKLTQKLIIPIKLAINELEQGAADMNQMNHSLVGRISIGSLPLARTCMLPDVISEMTNQYPQFSISIHDGPYHDLISHLRMGEIDIIVGALRYPLPYNDISQEIFFYSPTIIFGRYGHPLAHKSHIAIDDLYRYGWIVPRLNSPGRNIFEYMFLSNGSKIPEQIIEASSQMLTKKLLLDSNKLTISSKHQSLYELENNIFSEISYTPNNQQRAIGVTTRKSWKGTILQEEFIQKLKNKGAEILQAYP